MSSARDYFTSSMADALLPSLRRSFEDVVYETLDHRQVPTRTDFKDLRDQLNGLRGQLTGAVGGVKKLSDDLEGAVDRLSALEARTAAMEAKVEALGDTARRLADLQVSLEALAGELAAIRAAGAPAASAVEQAPAAERATEQRVCRVPDCGEAPRSKGFCARHYQLWRRGKLEGFPVEG